MFLFDASFATDVSQAEAEIKRILDRAEAELVFCRKWDERRLAYEIAGRRRGTYMLTYFRCPAEALAGIERDAQLSEHVLRVLVLQADHVTPDQMNQFAPEKHTAATPSEQPTPEAAEAAVEVPAQEDVVRVDAEPVASSAGADDVGDAVET